MNQLPTHLVSDLSVNAERINTLIEQKGIMNAARIFGYDVSNYDNLVLAGRILLWDLKQSAPKSVSEYVSALEHRLQPDIAKYMLDNQDLLQAEMDKYDHRDLKHDWMSANSLYRTYLSKPKFGADPCETPQQCNMRIATQLYYNYSQDSQESAERVLQCYRELAEGWYVHASPTIFNAGMKKHQMASCFFTSMEDSIDGMKDVWGMIADVSKHNGGLGIDVSCIRHSEIGDVGMSSGVIPLIQVLNSIIRLVNQTGKRKGAATVYLRPHHIDIFEFCSLSLKTGDPYARAHDINTALWDCWLFQYRVDHDMDWTLFCPNYVKQLNNLWGEDFIQEYIKAEADTTIPSHAKRVVKARDLYEHIISCQKKSSMPYMLSGDACNAKSNHQHQGYIPCSNLCVAPETLILTKAGHLPIASLVDQEVEVWNGNQWSKVTIRRTGTSQKLITVKLSNHYQLTCTEYHKFLLQQGSNRLDIKNATRVEASKLQPGDKLLEYGLPTGLGVSLEVVDVVDNGRYDDTYCFNEPINHAGIFNGILTGQCLEVIERSAPGRIASCNLGSLSLRKYASSKTKTINYSMLGKMTRSLTRNLNQVIRNNWYPLPTIEGPNFEDMPIAIGVSGYAEMLHKLDIPFDDPRAFEVNKKIFACMYFNSLAASVNEALRIGTYPSFKGSPLSQGKFQFDLWAEEYKLLCKLGMKPPTNIRKPEDDIPLDPQDWGQEPITLSNDHVIQPTFASLMEAIQKFGVANSLNIALMPTASSAQILRNCESVEAHQANLYSRKLISGAYPVVNRYLVKDLQEIGGWTRGTIDLIQSDRGSICKLDQVIAKFPDKFPEFTGNWDRLKYIQKKYMTMWELSQKVFLKMAADRGRYICHSQSTNIYIADPRENQLRAIHRLTAYLGLKTRMYYLRSLATVEPIKFTVDRQIANLVEGISFDNDTKDVKETTDTKNGKKIICTDDVCIVCQ